MSPPVLFIYVLPFALWAVLGSHGIVVKCTAAIFSPTEDRALPSLREKEIVDVHRQAKLCLDVWDRNDLDCIGK